MGNKLNAYHVLLFDRIYACATMWHETKEEMKLLLESGIRMDLHSTASDTGYDYSWELHIFFDDAFQKNRKKKKEGEEGSEEIGKAVNDYVLTLIEAMHEVHVDKNKFRQRTTRDSRQPPSLSHEARLEKTEYGGRITWELEHGTKVVCHLKDKELIRHKKRWSQCMYFEYFYRQSDLYDEHGEIQPGEGSSFAKQVRKGLRKSIKEPQKPGVLKSENTFLLALDGDVDFDHLAVTRLLDVMQKNKNIGAACGRIHPTGSGLIAGYQKFEYAVGHWFQKSTEDALGNVLCSPGCFSLFRLRAVCENHLPEVQDRWDNKMIKKREKDGEFMEAKMPKYMGQLEKNEDLAITAKDKYFTVTKSGIQSIQYDQGEDRWLCTLLIIRGWEVRIIRISFP